MLPGFGLTLGFTLLYLGLIVLIPLSALFLKTSTLSWAAVLARRRRRRACWRRYRLSFGASLLGAR